MLCIRNQPFPKSRWFSLRFLRNRIHRPRKFNRRHKCKNNRNNNRRLPRLLLRHRNRRCHPWLSGRMMC